MSSEHTGLPEGWEVCTSQSRQLPYYFCAATNDSRWEPPEGTNLDMLKPYVAAHFKSPDNTGKIRASHLLIKHKDSRRPSSWKEAEITRTKDEAKATILGHEARIRSGAATLSDLAKTESDCSSHKRGGDLGWFGHGEMQKEFEDAAFALKPGELSHPVDTASGIHLIERTA